MMSVKQMSIAVVGDQDLVSGMRLAGASRYTIIEDGSDPREAVRQAVMSYMSEDIGVIAIQEDFMPHVQDIVRKMREEKKLFPAIIEVPSKRGSKVESIIAGYRSYIRKFVGFDIQI